MHLLVRHIQNDDIRTTRRVLCRKLKEAPALSAGNPVMGSTRGGK
jgi:hypothetical protein